jgi:AcrR family transcriptional regulator
MTSELPAAPSNPAEPRKSRKNNPEKTRENILQEAIVEFVQQGLSGARVDAIAERIHTSKRMIYYYFGSKEQLYVEVLEKLYGDIRSTENRLHLAELPRWRRSAGWWSSPSITMTATSISCASSASKTSTTPST